MLRLVQERRGRWRRSTVQTPVGPLTVIHAAPRVVVAAAFVAGESAPSHWFGRPTDDAEPPSWLAVLVDEASQGTLTRPWTLMDPGLTPLTARALTAAVAVPFATVTSYGELAQRIGLPRGARLVGLAMSRSPAALLVPTHRVVRADGRAAPVERGGIADALRAYEKAIGTGENGRDGQGGPA